MDRAWTLIVVALLAWSQFSTARADEPRLNLVGRQPAPENPSTIVARVKVNVETDVDVAKDHAPPKPKEKDEGDDDEDEDEDDEEQAGQGDFIELVNAVLGQGGASSGVSVIADINVNVQTSIKVRGSSAKPHGPKPHPKPPGPPPHLRGPADDEARPGPAPHHNPPRMRKKHRPRPQPGPAEQGAMDEADEPEERPRSLSLNRLKLGDKLELGVTGRVGSDEQAAHVARRINAGKGQSLLGMAMLGMMVPEESESLRVVREAISSVQADASGSDVSVSVAIPKETPSAVKSLVQAALNRE